MENKLIILSANTILSFIIKVLAHIGITRDEIKRKMIF